MKNLFFQSCVTVFLFAAAVVGAQSPVTVSIDTHSPGAEVSPQFSGFSFETQMVLSNEAGKYYFSPSNKPLIKLFQTLGIKNLRIGGNTADRDTVAIPTNSDIDSLYAFAKAAGVKIIYTVRLKGGDAQQDAQIAKYIMDHYAADTTCIAIGNEPNVFAKEYPVYRDEWKKFMETIAAVAPTAKFCGPSATPGKTAWARSFIEDFGHSGKVTLITQHAYPGGAGNKVTNTADGRDLMLSPKFVAGYEKFYDAFAADAISNGLPYRLEEANSFFNGGANGVSDTFASALWALDFMHWWAAHGADGINFHTGDKVAIGGKSGRAGYASFTTSPGGHAVHPIAYGIQAFGLAGYGRSLPVKIGNNDQLNMSAYAIASPDGATTLTLINKEHGASGRDAEVQLELGTNLSSKVLFLHEANSDVAATSGVTLGGGEIKEDGTWSGRWTQLPRVNGIKLKVPAASAAIIKLAGDSTVDVRAIDRERILKAADAALQREPVSITAFRAKLSEGGEHDFYSNGDYWWPDPSKSNGLPYIQRDGQSNPGNFTQHRTVIKTLRDSVAALAAAYKITGNDKYAAQANEFLRVFFLDPKTRMNPSLQYAQAVPGVSPGRGTGIIDTLHLIEVPKAIEAMQHSPALPPETLAGLKQWFHELADWMITSKNGQDEARAGNNHAVAFYLQLAVFADFTGDQEKLEQCRKRYKEVFVGKQMATDGSFPAELKRTKPYGYSIFQLDNMATLCQVLSTPDENLWNYTLPDGRGIRKAMEFMYPYLADKSTWPRKPDVQAWDGWPAREPSLLFAGIALDEPRYRELWKKLPGDPKDAEVQRNIAITQPVLWIK